MSAVPSDLFEIEGDPRKELTVKELVDLSAADSIFYSKMFFPKTFRQVSPIMHRKVWDLLDGAEYPEVGLEMFRGSGKTTLARTNISKRIAYGISRTILPVSASLAHATRTVKWIRKQVETNSLWAQVYGLRKGSKWSDEEIEVISEVAGLSVAVLAVGILGQVRGVNVDDYRPDFILADDPCDEENSGTEEQRKKTAALFFGALQPGLTPRSESEHSKIALLQTGLHKEDLINTAHKDPSWHTVKYGILDYDELGHPHSAWPERWTTDEVLTKKANYTRRGQLHLWLREYECEITSPEEAPLKMEWLRYYEHMPEVMVIYVGIDPARERSKMPHKTAISVVGVTPKKEAYLLDYFTQTGLNPEEVWNAFYGMALRWRPYKTSVESIAYQQALAWYFRQKMQQVGTFWQVHEIEDRRKKRDRIIQELTGRASEGKLYVRADQQEWINSYRDWRAGEDNDLLDSTALALTGAGNALIYGPGGEGFIPLMDESSIPDFKPHLGCP